MTPRQNSIDLVSFKGIPTCSFPTPLDHFVLSTSKRKSHPCWGSFDTYNESSVQRELPFNGHTLGLFANGTKGRVLIECRGHAQVPYMTWR